MLIGGCLETKGVIYMYEVVIGSVWYQIVSATASLAVTVSGIKGLLKFNSGFICHICSGFAIQNLKPSKGV